MEIGLFPPFLKDGSINVIIETPRGSQNKYAYDPEMRVFKLKKTLPMGTVFPFDFGFIPNTRAEDGDPLDVLIIMEEPTFPGCLIECRLMAVLEATQQENGKSAIRNDRMVAVSNASVLYRNITAITELNRNMAKEIENFFIDYNKHEGKKFKPVKWKDASKAFSMVKKAIKSKE